MSPIGMAFAAPPKRQAATKLAAKIVILRIGFLQSAHAEDCSSVSEPPLKSVFIWPSAKGAFLFERLTLLGGSSEGTNSSH